MNQFTIEDAIMIACKYHRNQKDKAGFPYILHPLRVMNSVDGLFQKMVAVSHDMLEDCSITVEQLRELGYPPKVIGAIEILTKRKGESHENYIMRIIESGNPLAISVKWADVIDNSDPKRLMYLPLEDQTRMAIKYAKTKKLLMENM